ncbi:fructose-bisphosphate aldolase class I domain protein, partial [Chlamydia psittaci C1/97]
MSKIYDLLGDDAEALLKHKCKHILKENLTLPSPDFVDKVFSYSDRNNLVLRSLQSMFSHGRLGNTGYLSILPVDQGVEHTAG